MFSKQNISSIPTEETPHATGSRKVLANKSDVSSNFFDAYTYGYLPAGETWAMHQHDGIVEICLVVKGTGQIFDKDRNIEDFSTGDRFIFPPNTPHQLTNTGNEVAEFYFIRIQSS